MGFLCLNNLPIYRRLFLGLLFSCSLLLFMARFSCAKSVEVAPINNNTPDSMGKSGYRRRSINVDEERAILDSYYQNKVGSTGDDFIPFAESPDFVNSIPNGQKGTVTHKGIDRLRKDQSERFDDAQWEQYFVMQKRIMAPTTKP